MTNLMANINRHITIDSTCTYILHMSVCSVAKVTSHHSLPVPSQRQSTCSPWIVHVCTVHVHTVLPCTPLYFTAELPTSIRQCPGGCMALSWERNVFILCTRSRFSVGGGIGWCGSEGTGWLGRLLWLSSLLATLLVIRGSTERERLPAGYT